MKLSHTSLWRGSNGSENRHSLKNVWLQLCVGRVDDDLNEYIAHCCELDLISLGGSVVDTLKTLLTTIDVQFGVCHRENYEGDQDPELFYDCDRFWKIWHINATLLTTTEIDGLKADWIASHETLSLKVVVMENFSEMVRKIKSLNECYNLFEVLKSINCQLDNRYRLRLVPVKNNKDYYSLQGIGYSDHVQSYPLPLFQLYNLSAHHISRIIRRFCLQSVDMSELHLSQV